MKSSNLCLKEQAASGTNPAFKPSCRPCFTNPLSTQRVQGVIILLSVNLVPLLPTGVLGSSAANKEHINREDQRVERERWEGYKQQSKQRMMLDAKHNLPGAQNAQTAA